MRNIIFAVAVACVAAGCATKQVERTSVRFLHWSVSHFSDGAYSVASIPESEGKGMAAKYAKFLNSVDADIVVKPEATLHRADFCSVQNLTTSPRLKFLDGNEGGEWGCGLG